MNKNKTFAQQQQTATLVGASKFEAAKKKRKRFGEDFETGNISDEFDDDQDDELRVLYGSSNEMSSTWS
ncbi:unnamed protein product [Rotaria sp. Silwood1]|nr:unnamed protein product [Rotaria sp. Silwood1]